MRRVRTGRADHMHLDRSYVYQGGDHDEEWLFALEDLTECVTCPAEDVGRALAEMRAALRCGKVRAIAVCEEPYTCPFYEHTPRRPPGRSVRRPAKLTRKLRERMTSA